MNTTHPHDNHSLVNDPKPAPVRKRAARSSRRFRFKYLFRALARDPLRYIAYFAAIALVYITILFIQFGNDLDKKTQNFPLKATVTFKANK
jgi:hypothetical protein